MVLILTQSNSEYLYEFCKIRLLKNEFTSKNTIKNYGVEIQSYFKIKLKNRN